MTSMYLTLLHYYDRATVCDFVRIRIYILYDNDRYTNLYDTHTLILTIHFYEHQHEKFRNSK